MAFPSVSTRWRCWAWSWYPCWWPGCRTDSEATLEQVRLCLCWQNSFFVVRILLFWLPPDKLPNLVSAPQPYRSLRRCKRPSARPRPKSAPEADGASSQPTGERLTPGGGEAAHRHVAAVCSCSICGTGCWEASNTRTAGPEKGCAFVSSPLWTRESNLKPW